MNLLLSTLQEAHVESCISKLRDKAFCKMRDNLSALFKENYARKRFLPLNGIPPFSPGKRLARLLLIPLKQKGKLS
jgi:hypothetical protein